MRQSKNELIGYDALDDKEAFTTTSIKLQRQKEFYKDFSNSANLRYQHDRHQLLGFDRSISQKSVWAYKKTILTNANGEPIMKVSKTKIAGKPNSITQVENKRGGIDRNYYGPDGKQTKQISNNDHGNAKTHPNGAHAHDYIYDENGKLVDRKVRDISEKERKENSDIL